MYIPPSQNRHLQFCGIKVLNWNILTLGAANQSSHSQTQKVQEKGREVNFGGKGVLGM